MQSRFSLSVYPAVSPLHLYTLFKQLSFHGFNSECQQPLGHDELHHRLHCFYAGFLINMTEFRWKMVRKWAKELTWLTSCYMFEIVEFFFSFVSQLAMTSAQQTTTDRNNKNTPPSTWILKYFNRNVRHVSGWSVLLRLAWILISGEVMTVYLMY